MAAMIAPESVVTFEHAEGFRVVRSFGVMRAEAARPHNLLLSTLRSLGAFLGLLPPEFLTDAERARGEAVAALVARAERLGANSIIGLRFDACETSDGSTVVSALGEAVVLEPAPRLGAT